jgi:hypothetical protein
MSGGFANPIVGAGGGLVYPSIHSPNFIVANPAASPSPSWAILKTGLAYFFGLNLSGGTITGPDYIINTSGIFIYSGTPATGNLIGSWAGASGTDIFGNIYPAGFNISSGAVSGTTFTGANWIINAAGFFIYSGTPSGPTGGALAEIAVTPEIAGAAGGVASSTHTFSPPAGSMVIVPVSWLFASNIGASVTCKDSLGNAYTAGPQVQDAFGVGISAVFSHVYAAAPGPVTVKVTCTNTGAANAVLAPRVVTGQAASQAGAATVAAAGGPSLNVQQSITLTKQGSYAYAAADTSGVATLTAIASTTTILADRDALVGDTGATGRTAAPTVTPGPVTIGWTSSQSNSYALAALEVLPSSGAGNLIGSWAGQAGTDAFGNSYPQGLSVDIGAITGTAITGSSFAGTNFILDGNGGRWYSSTPAKNNLIASIGNAQYTDAFTNIVLPGLVSYNLSPYVAFQLYNGQLNLYYSGTDETSGWNTGSQIFTQLSGQVAVTDATDAQTYSVERKSLKITSPVLINTTGPTAFFSSPVAAGATAARSYRIHGLAYFVANQSAGQFALTWNCSGFTPQGLLNVWLGTGPTFNDIAPIGAGANANPGVTMVNGTIYKMHFDGTILVPAGSSGIFSVSGVVSIAADTLNVAVNSFIDIMPV